LTQQEQDCGAGATRLICWHVTPSLAIVTAFRMWLQCQRFDYHLDRCGGIAQVDQPLDFI
jgi:hypothetical protein